MRTIEPAALYALEIGLAMLLALLIMLLASAVRSLAKIAEIMFKCHAAEIDAFDQAAQKKADAFPAPASPSDVMYRYPESG